MAVVVVMYSSAVARILTCSLLVLIVFLMLTLPSHVTGFRSATFPRIQQHHSYTITHVTPLHRVCRAHKVLVLRHNINVGTNELNDKEPEVVIQIEDLDLSQIAELIEVSFIQACMVHDFVVVHVHNLSSNHTSPKKTSLTHRKSHVRLST